MTRNGTLEGRYELTFKSGTLNLWLTDILPVVRFNLSHVSCGEPSLGAEINQRSPTANDMPTADSPQTIALFVDAFLKIVLKRPPTKPPPITDICPQ